MTVTTLRILVLEDNDDLREGWLAFFRSRGHHARGIALADELLDLSGDFHPDVFVIDLNLPDADGLTVVQRLRAVQPNVGIIITTARSHIGDKVVGYDSGADIYLTKPVEPAELMAGIASLARRRSGSSRAEAELRLELDRHRLSGPRATVILTPGETLLLAGLARAAGQPLARWQIAELLDSGDELPSDAMLEMRMTRLRRRLISVGVDDPAIRAIYRKGYVLLCRVELA